MLLEEFKICDNLLYLQFPGWRAFHTYLAMQSIVTAFGREVVGVRGGGWGLAFETDDNLFVNLH